MGITDELREWFSDRLFMGNGYAELVAIADRIDAEHERACAEAYGNGVMSVPIALDESAWVELPKDADGVPIRIGDVIDEIAVATYPFVPAKVVGYHECCGEVLPIVENDGEFQVIPEKVCHHHAPTVEDVLLDLLEEHSDPTCDATPSELAEKYAAKLRLAEGVE